MLTFSATFPAFQTSQSHLENFLCPIVVCTEFQLKSGNFSLLRLERVADTQLPVILSLSQTDSARGYMLMSHPSYLHLPTLIS